MIYLSHTDVSQPASIPRPSSAMPEAGPVLELRNNVGRTVTVPAVSADDEPSRLYYRLQVTLPDGLKEGEYDYRLLSGGEVLSCGVARIGDYGHDIKDYNKNTEYEQYNA